MARIVTDSPGLGLAGEKLILDAAIAKSGSGSAGLSLRFTVVVETGEKAP